MFAGLLAVACMVVGVGCLVFLVAGLLTRRSWSRRARWAGGIGVALSALAFGGVAGCTNALWGPTENPAKVYALAFGKPPPPQVTALRGVASFGPDCAAWVVEFTTDEPTFQSLRRVEWVESPSERPPRRDDVPWWSTTQDPGAKIYTHGFQTGDRPDRSRNRHGLAFESTWVSWNPATGRVRLWWEGVD